MTAPPMTTELASVDLETAVVISVDRPELETIYRDSFPAFAELGIPLHVTLLYPFAPPEQLSSALPVLQTVLSHHEPFTYELTELRTFPRAIWLAPEPAVPFVALTEAIEAALPQYPHWGGAFEAVIPHTTLVDGQTTRPTATQTEKPRVTKGKRCISSERSWWSQARPGSFGS